jgi:hypothetical protein
MPAGVPGIHHHLIRVMRDWNLAKVSLLREMRGAG